MPYKIHLENKTPGPGIEIGGKLIGAHIITETAPLLTVETKEEALEILKDFCSQGITGIYAVGHDA